MFNQQGEANVTCVDIAVELDISPGNLYYHFKGKEVIVSALFDMYLERTSKILVSPDSENLTISDFFSYLLSLLESAHLFQFIYRNPTDLMQKYPAIARSFQRLIKSKAEAFLALLNHFESVGLLNASHQQQVALSQLINLVFTQSQSYFLLTENSIDEDDCFTSLLWVYHALTPYLVLAEQEQQKLEQAITEQNI